MKSYLIIFIQSALFMIYIAACENSHEIIGQASTTVVEIDENFILNPSPSAALFASAQSVFNNKCLGCHGPGGIGGQINLNSVIADGFVTQGPASSSILFNCVNSTTCIGRLGQNTGNMILFGNLTQGEANTISAFVDDLYIDPF